MHASPARSPERVELTSDDLDEIWQRWRRRLRAAGKVTPHHTFPSLRRQSLCIQTGVWCSTRPNTDPASIPPVAG
jgi:hypothetical protein